MVRKRKFFGIVEKIKAYLALPSVPFNGCIKYVAIPEQYLNELMEDNKKLRLALSNLISYPCECPWTIMHQAKEICFKEIKDIRYELKK